MKWWSWHQPIPHRYLFSGSYHLIRKSKKMSLHCATGSETSENLGIEIWLSICLIFSCQSLKASCSVALTFLFVSWKMSELTLPVRSLLVSCVGGPFQLLWVVRGWPEEVRMMPVEVFLEMNSKSLQKSHCSSSEDPSLSKESACFELRSRMALPSGSWTFSTGIEVRITFRRRTSSARLLANLAASSESRCIRLEADSRSFGDWYSDAIGSPRITSEAKDLSAIWERKCSFCGGRRRWLARANRGRFSIFVKDAVVLRRKYNKTFDWFGEYQWLVVYRSFHWH